MVLESLRIHKETTVDLNAKHKTIEGNIEEYVLDLGLSKIS